MDGNGGARPGYEYQHEAYRLLVLDNRSVLNCGMRSVHECWHEAREGRHEA